MQLLYMYTKTEANSGGSRNKERARRTQQMQMQILLIIHKNTPFRAFFAYFSHAKVQSTAADCSGMVCSSPASSETA